MSISHLLEKFETRVEAGTNVSMSELKLEEEKLQAFERGYGAGWEDAQKAQESNQSKVTDDFANNLSELSFTYHEAYGHLVKALQPLLDRIVDTVLPDIAKQSLGPQLAAMLAEAASTGCGQPIEIVVSPANEEFVQGVLANNDSLPATIVSEPSLGEGQAYIRFGDSEQQIDFDTVLQGVSQAVAAFFEELQHSEAKETKHAG